SPGSTALVDPEMAGPLYHGLKTTFVYSGQPLGTFWAQLRGLRLLRRAGPNRFLPLFMGDQAILLGEMGQGRRARAAMAEGLAIAEEIGDPLARGQILARGSFVLMQEGDL